MIEGYAHILHDLYLLFIPTFHHTSQSWSLIVGYTVLSKMYNFYHEVEN